METFKKILMVPADHKLKIEITLPESFPMGATEVILIFAPKSAGDELTDNMGIMKLAGCLKGSVHFNADPLTLQKNLRNEWPN